MGELSQKQKAYHEARSTKRREKLTAYHEAGHSVAAVTLGIGVVSASIVLDAKRNSEGVVHYRTDGVWSRSRFRQEAKIAVEKLKILQKSQPVLPLSGNIVITPPSRDEFLWSGTRNRAQKYWMTSVAGFIAESKFNGRWPNLFVAKDDFETSRDFRNWFTLDKAEGSLLSRQIEKKTRKLLNAHWPEVVAVADALLEHKRLTGKQVRQIMTAVLQPKRDRMLSFMPSDRG